jgi:GTP-binding protein HflX
LEQTTDAHLLVHVCDAGHPRVDEQIRAVDAVLDEIGAGALPRVLALNKVDVADDATVRRLLRVHDEAVAVSAATGEGVEALVAAVTSRLASSRRLVEALVPYEHADLVASLERFTVGAEGAATDGAASDGAASDGAATDSATTDGATAADR